MSDAGADAADVGDLRIPAMLRGGRTSTLRQHAWTISPVPRAPSPPNNAPPSTKYSPNYFATSKLMKAKGGTIPPLPKGRDHHKQKKAEAMKKKEEQFLSMDALDAVYKDLDTPKSTPHATPSPGLHDSGASGNASTKRPKKAMEPWRRMPERDTRMLGNLTTPPPGYYGGKDRNLWADARGGKIDAKVDRFRASSVVAETPGPGDYTPQSNPASGNRGASFGKAGPPRCTWGSAKEGFLPGPGAYDKASYFAGRVQPISTAAAGVLAERIPIDFDAPTPALLDDIRFVRATAEDIARMKLRT